MAICPACAAALKRSDAGRVLARGGGAAAPERGNEPEVASDRSAAPSSPGISGGIDAAVPLATPTLFDRVELSLPAEPKATRG